MFICSIRARNLKVIGLILLTVVVGVSAALGSAYRDNHSVVATGTRQVRYDGIKTEEDLLNFISMFGITVKTPPVRSVDVDLPRVFDAVYAKYNDIQKKQGFDLSKYRGKSLHRYTFEITNYPTADEKQAPKVYLTLFTYKDKVVGGDISSRDMGGFVRTFTDFSFDNAEEG